MILERYRAEHLRALQLQPSQAYFGTLIDADYRVRLEFAGPAYTAFDQGRPYFCGGFIETDYGAQLWAFIAQHARHKFIEMHRAVMRAFEAHGYGELTATTEADFADGCRWLALLKFERLGLLSAFGPDGRDHWLYRRKKA